jgi:predicted transcriptional regulator
MIVPIFTRTKKHSSMKTNNRPTASCGRREGQMLAYVYTGQEPKTAQGIAAAKGVTDSTIHNWRDRLLEEGYLEEDGKWFTVTRDGEAFHAGHEGSGDKVEKFVRFCEYQGS